MKKFFYLFLLAGFVGFTACEKDDDHDHEETEETHEYHAHINSPTTDDKKVDDMVHLHIDFEDHNEGTVHHVNVKIYKKDDPTVIIYDGPSEAHVHADKKYEHHDDIMLDAATGVDGHTDWILEAKVWGHEAGVAEVTETIEFHVHPN